MLNKADYTKRMKLEWRGSVKIVKKEEKNEEGLFRVGKTEGAMQEEVDKTPNLCPLQIALSEAKVKSTCLNLIFIQPSGNRNLPEKIIL